MSFEEIFEGREEKALKEVNEIIKQIKSLKTKYPDRFGLEISLKGYLNQKERLEAAITKKKKVDTK